MSAVVRDYDYHPSEPTVRVFSTPETGVLRFDDSVLVTEARFGDAVLRHYAFADRWYKVNVTTDASGNLVETGPSEVQFAFNCDIATPMRADGSSVFAVDLYLDVLVRADGYSYVVTDEDDFATAVAEGLISQAEEIGARTGLDELVEIIEEGQLVALLDEVVPFGPSSAGAALSVQREPVPPMLQARGRSTW